MDDDKVYPNIVNVAQAQDGKRLTKIAYPNPDDDIDYDKAYRYRFFHREAYGLSDVFDLVKLCLYKPNCCFLRGIAKFDDARIQRRLLHDRDGIDATIIEQPQNWYALDVDKYGNSTGDIKQDTLKVLLALGLEDTEAFAIPSSGYLRKPGIRLRIFLWNSVRIDCDSLKKHFGQLGVVDTALFSAVQPIYIARPIFNGMSDPCKVLWTWIPGSKQFTEIRQIYSDTNKNREYHQVSTSIAKAWLNRILREMQDIKEHDRHIWLFKEVVGIAKPCIDGVLDEDETKEELADAAYMWWHGNRRNDRRTIEDAFKTARQRMEGNNGCV